MRSAQPTLTPLPGFEHANEGIDKDCVLQLIKQCGLGSPPPKDSKAAYRSKLFLLLLSLIKLCFELVAVNGPDRPYPKVAFEAKK